MSRKLWGFLVLDVIILAVLFLASSTDVVLKERIQKSHKITVITDSETEDEGETFRLGINKAAIDANMDVSMVSLAEEETAEARKAVLQKELDNGMEGLVLHCKSIEKADEIISALPVGMPVVLYASEATSPRVRGTIGESAEQETALLMEAVLRGRQKGQDVTIVERSNQGDRTTAIHDSVEKALTEEGILVRHVMLDDFSGAGTLVRGMHAQGGNILVTADFPLLKALGEGAQRQQISVPLYGMGWGLRIRNVLEEGYITATVVRRGYEGGYFAVKKMGDILENRGAGQAEMPLECTVVTKDNLYDKDTVTFVFPYV